jgi:predicted SAM-dependent methyltransferase
MENIKLHLGCGKRYLPGYKHIDLSHYPHIDFVHDLRQLPMIENGSVEIIYASHVLEYFDDEEVKFVLHEWHSKLQPKGILRLAVPDFEALAKVYLQYKMVSLVSGPIYGRWAIDKATIVNHKAIYDKEKLSEVLYKAEFSTVRPWNWREVFSGELSGFDDYSQSYLPHLDKENGTLISLNLEGIK